MPTPRYTLTYQPTLDDQVMASIAMTSGEVRVARVFGLRLLFTALTCTAVGYWFYNMREPVWAVAGVFGVFILNVPGLTAALKLREVIEKRVRRIYAKKKNIGLAVPARVTLYDTYLESSSTLERTQVAWDVVEEVTCRDGFVLITHGMASVFLPERIFENEAACASFVQLAQSLHAAALAQPGDLTATRWTVQ